MLTQEKIQKILTDHFHPVMLRVTDDSHQHAGHNPSAADGGTHFSIAIVSDLFTGKKLVERHRMVYAVLEHEFKDKLHALVIKAYSPGEIHNI